MEKKGSINWLSHPVEIVSRTTQMHIVDATEYVFAKGRWVQCNNRLILHIYYWAVQYCKVYFREDKKRLLLEQHADGPWYSEFEGFRIADFHMYRNYDWVSLFHIVFLKPYLLQLSSAAKNKLHKGQIR